MKNIVALICLLSLCGCFGHHSKCESGHCTTKCVNGTCKRVCVPVEYEKETK